VAEHFIDVGIEADEAALADLAVERLQLTWPDWEPNEGDLEVVQIEALAQMASDAASVAAVVPAQAFEAIMVDLYGLAPRTGSAASGDVTFTLLDTAAHTIPAGTEIDIDGWAFTTDIDVNTAALSAPGIPVTCAVIDEATNALPGDEVTMITALAFVGSVHLDAPTTGAVELESDDDFLDRGTRTLELQAITLVTERDYELMALSLAGVERVIAQANLATRTIVVTASAANGDVLSGTIKTALAALFDEYRQTTWVVTLGDATKTTIGVTYSIHVLPGYEPTSVLAEATGLVAAFLDPQRWNVSKYERAPATTWNIEPRVRKNKLIDVIGDTHGVDYVNDVTITGSAGSLQANGDWLMPGTVPLPVAGTIAGSVV
jgi:hypothetical protein